MRSFNCKDIVPLWIFVVPLWEEKGIFVGVVVRVLYHKQMKKGSHDTHPGKLKGGGGKIKKKKMSDMYILWDILYSQK